MTAETDAVLKAPVTIAELMLWLFGKQGVRYIFFNPGTDTAPLQEAVVSLAKRGVVCPEVVTCTHEAVALAAAHAFYQATHEPQVVVVHVDVGTQNLGAMLHNVQRDQAGVVILAGKAPYTIDGSCPGGKSSEIHWYQEEADQIGIVRNYVKWAQEITCADTAARAVSRALQIARSSPAGPTYLMIGREVLMEEAVVSSVDRSTGYTCPAGTSADPVILGRMAELLSRAKRPVVVTSRVGRDPEAVAALTKLIELLGAPVFGGHEALNCSWRHPLYVREAGEGRAALAQADAVLIVGCVVPWIPAVGEPPADAAVAYVDIDPLHADIPLWSFPIDISVQATPRCTLNALIDAIEALGRDDPVLRRMWHERRIALSDGRGGAPEPAGGGDPGSAPSARDVMVALNASISLQDIVLDESVTNKNVLHKHLDRDLAATVYSAGGPGLGWALGAAVGMGLARREGRVVAIVGDGAFVFGQPIAAFMLSSEARTPFLVVVLNNKGYRASRLPVFDLYPNGTSAVLGDAVATHFSLSPNFSLVAEACGAHGERVTARETLVPALKRAVAAVDDGRCALVDVLLERS